MPSRPHTAPQLLHTIPLPQQAHSFVKSNGSPVEDDVVHSQDHSPCQRKHRIEIMMGRRKVTIAWYGGAAASDIKAAIARRFALLPGTQWALMDNAYDEIIISDGVPSGRYTLTVFS